MAKKSFFNNPAANFIKEEPDTAAAQEIFSSAPAAELLFDHAAAAAPAIATPPSPLVSALHAQQTQHAKQTDTGSDHAQDSGSVGRIISVSSLKVEIFLRKTDICIRDLLYTEKDGERYLFEVQEINGSVAAAICCGQTHGLMRGMEVYLQQGGLQIAYDDQILGHVFSSYGDTIDGTTLDAPPHPQHL